MTKYFFCAENCSSSTDGRLKFVITPLQPGITYGDAEIQLTVVRDGHADHTALAATVLMNEGRQVFTIVISSRQEAEYLLSLRAQLDVELRDYEVMRQVASGLLSMFRDGRSLAISTTYQVALRGEALKLLRGGYDMRDNCTDQIDLIIDELRVEEGKFAEHKTRSTYGV